MTEILSRVPIPRGWTSAPLWSYFRRLKRTGHEDEELLSVYRDYGVIPRASRDDNFNKASDDLSGYQLVEPGDLVVNKMKAWQGSLGVSRHRGIVSPAYFVYALQGQLDARFIHYLLRSQPYASWYRAISKGIRPNQWDLIPEDFGRVPVLTPPLDEQHAIADFLDRETAQIDAMVDAQERLIERLVERRHAWITEQVAPSPLPPGWEDAQLRRLCLQIVDCHHSTPDVSEDGAYEAVRTASVRDGQYRPEHSLRVDEATYDARNVGATPSAGDILFTREAPAGEACLVPEDRKVCLGQRMVLLRVDKTQIDPRLVLWSIYSDPVKHYFEVEMNGSTVGNLKMASIGRIPIKVPPVESQASIAVRLTDGVDRIDAMIAKAQESIALMKERRSAVISAAVTGRIDVRTGIEQVERDLEEARA